ncbi:uncharacterized protein TNCV_81171 [Trichonephila clavipes]|nr:uncharacterized protein TNCV_81171 [Trichonephila clavipes]
MAYLAKARKDDLKTLATELGLEIEEMMRVIDFKNLILASKDYDEHFTKTLLETIVETRVEAERDEKEESEYKRKQEGLILELERMNLEVKDFNSLNNLVLTNQLKKRVAKEVKGHFVDIWGDIKSSSKLVQKLDDYEVARGSAFEKTVISLSFADGIVSQKEVLRTFQTVILEGRKFKTNFIILPDAKHNSTLLGVDFLENAGIVLNFRKNCWTFCDDSRKLYNFVTPYHSTSVNVRPVAVNNCQLRENEGQELLGSQRVELDSLL